MIMSLKDKASDMGSFGEVLLKKLGYYYYFISFGKLELVTCCACTFIYYQLPINNVLKLGSLIFQIQDGSIWKERLSASVQRRADLPVMKEGAHLETGATGTKTRPSPVRRSSLPSSISAPEHNILQFLEECKAAGI